MEGQNFFPDQWTPKDIVNAIGQVLKLGKEVVSGDKDSRSFVGIIDKTVVKVVTDYNMHNIKSAFPLPVVPAKFDSYFEENKINDFYDAVKANPQQFYGNLNKCDDNKFKNKAKSLKKLFLNTKKDLNIDKLLFLYRKNISENDEFTIFLTNMIDISNQSNSSDDDTQIEPNNFSNKDQFDIYRFINEEQISLEDFLLNEDQVKQNKPLTEYQLNEIEKFFWTTEAGNKVKEYLSAMVCSSTVCSIKNFIGKFPENSVISLPGINSIKITGKTKSNILFGCYDEHLGFLETPGHTKLALDLANEVTKQKRNQLLEISMEEMYDKKVLGGSWEPYYKDKTRNKNISKYVFFDSKEGPKTTTVFPENWTLDKIMKSIKPILNEKKEINSEEADTRAFVGIAYGIPIKVVINNEVAEVMDVFPIDILSDEFENYYEKNKVAAGKEFFKENQDIFKEKIQKSTAKKETQPQIFEKSRRFTENSSKNSEKFSNQLTRPKKPPLNVQKPAQRPVKVDKPSNNNGGIQIQFSKTSKAPSTPSNPSNEKT